MSRSVVSAGLAAILVLAGAAPAAAISIEAITARAAEIPSSDIQDGEWPFDTLSPVLRSALDQAILQGDVEGAVARLAAILDGDRTAATSILGTTVEVFADYFPDCSDEEIVERAEQIEEDLLTAITSQATDEALSATGLFYNLWGGCLETRGDRLLDRLAALPDGSDLAERLALQLDEYDLLHQEVLGVAAKGRSPSLTTLEAMAESVRCLPCRASLLQAARTEARRTAPERLSEIERRRIGALLSAGLPAEALEAFRSSTDATRESIVRGEPLADREDQPPKDPRLDLAAALALVREDEGARELLAEISTDRRAVPDPSEAQERNRATQARLWQALDRLVATEHRSEDPFDLLAELALAADSFGDGGLSGRATVYQALAELALVEGYGGFARFFFHSFEASVTWESQAFTPSANSEDNPFLDGFPHAARAAHALVDRLVLQKDALGDRLTEAERPDPLAGRISELLTHPPLVPFRERTLPKGVPVGARGQSEFPAGLPVPPDLRIVRAERRGNETVAVGLAQALDPVGEVSAGGYWIARSTDGGASWTRLYTGLRQLQPYEVVEHSALPLLADDGVRIEVRVRELDESSITFPPVAMRTKREEDGLFLELPWEELERDRDADGLTDLVEERLLTDPEEADTDGDGVDDAEDPLPTVAFSAVNDPSSQALAALLTRISGEQARAILPRCPEGDSLCFGRPHLGEGRTHFVVGERSRWAGLAPRHRTIVLTRDELEAARDRFGVLYATRFPLIEVDRSGERAVIIWDRSWQGGAAYLRRGDDGWNVEIRSSWIT